MIEKIPSIYFIWNIFTVLLVNWIFVTTSRSFPIRVYSFICFNCKLPTLYFFMSRFGGNFKFICVQWDLNHLVPNFYICYYEYHHDDTLFHARSHTTVLLLQFSIKFFVIEWDQRLMGGITLLIRIVILVSQIS